ncbi:hypothetical protein EHS25_000459 [Saitozyma podzolica]|uniref:RRM domain-containing protein n=1 Tax=Saitozyma podzolica TaxID=1890683 RepID=A0A427YWA9_9TREE|nr:hypothetical protein EHS25_000459 [Saitozyma podzolica]
MPANAPLAGRFEEDPRVHFDKTAGKFQYEDEDTGKEYEWTGQVWVELVDEEQWKAQQAAYAVAGVDESTPANSVLAREERRNKKRKKGPEESSSNGTSRASGSGKPAPQPSAPKKTAVWVTNLPPNTTPETLASVFSKAGVLMVGDDGEPRVKLYYDDKGRFKGEALVMYFKEGSVDLAVRLLDDTELEMGAGFGNMRVKEADYDKSAKADTTERQEKVEQQERKKYSAEDKLRMTKRMKALQNKVTWHSDDESDEDGPAALTAPHAGASRFNRVVVLKGMFAMQDLDKDPSLLLELKEDVREEAESLGQVTSVILYDKEADGVMTVKFKDAHSAQACVLKMNGRFFDGRRIYAGIYTGKERYQRSGAGKSFGEGEDGDEEEQERLDHFAQWLVEKEGEEGED